MLTYWERAEEGEAHEEYVQTHQARIPPNIGRLLVKVDGPVRGRRRGVVEEELCLVEHCYGRAIVVVSMRVTRFMHVHVSISPDEQRVLVRAY